MKRIAVLALGTMIAAPAFAGGPVVVAEEPIVAAPAPVAVVEPVTGDWGGAYVGAQLGYADGTASTPIGTDFDADGALYGLHAGYRWDLGRTVLGVQGDYNFSDVKSDVYELDHTISLKGQAGYDFGRTLVYGTAGVVKAELETGAGSISDYGYVVGVGADYALNENWILGGELAYNKIDDMDGSDVDYDATQLQLKASYKF